MNAAFDMFGDAASTMLTLLVFLATATLAFAVMASLRLRGSMKRRAAGISLDSPGTSRSGLQGSRVAKRVMEYAQKQGDADTKDMKVLRKRLIVAGIYDPRAVGYFFLARIGLAIGLAMLAILLTPAGNASTHWLAATGAGLFGYLAPSLYLDRRIARRKQEHRIGFPDFLDLLVVCADAGLSLEASLDRVGRELCDTYPSLAANIHMTNLEIRAGRPLTDALEHFADRLGFDEARSFATLIAQSEELGSSITEALRIYSDDMRHKRLSIAEEKAYALPAKLSLPMMACIFPVLFVVILLPVVVRILTGTY
jgi:tight adherence protein C